MEEASYWFAIAGPAIAVGLVLGSMLLLGLFSGRAAWAIVLLLIFAVVQGGLTITWWLDMCWSNEDGGPLGSNTCAEGVMGAVPEVSLAITITALLVVLLAIRYARERE